MSLSPSRGAARPERIALSLTPDPRVGTPPPLPSRTTWPAGVVVGVFFVVFAAIAVSQLASLDRRSAETVFDLTAVLFQGFWLLGWSAGVLVLFLLTILLLFYRESMALTRARLIHVPRLGPLKVYIEYDLARVRDVRTEPAGGSGRARIRFDYGNGTVGLGNEMSRADAENIVRTIQRAVEAAAAGADASQRVGDGGESSPGLDLTRLLRPRTRDRAPPPPADSAAEGREDDAAVSSAALVAANAVPLLGLAAFGWDLAEIMVLFWAESGIVGFYSLLRLAVVARWRALLLGPFFVGHFGAFMAGHFMFIYYLFVRGEITSGGAPQGPEPAPLEALGEVFLPLWPALVALILSHGISFYTNFLRGREYEGRTASDQMTEPYRRVVVMHVTIVLGAGVCLLLGNPLPALALLIVLKTVMDLRAHRREHGAD